MSQEVRIHRTHFNETSVGRVIVNDLMGHLHQKQQARHDAC